MLIGGKDRPIEGNINALIELKNEHKLDIINGFDAGNFSFEAVRAVIFVTLKQGAKKQAKDAGEKFAGLDFTLDDVGDWLTAKTMQDVLQECLKALMGGAEAKGEEGAGESLGANSEK